MKVTVGIPFFNNEKSLSYAIKSVIHQTYKDLEIILIDDGSKDQSIEIANQFSTIDSRIKIFSDGINKGLIERLNQIIDMATGDFIARMDADDMLDPRRIELQVNYLNSNPKVDVVTTGMISLDKYLNPVGKRCCNTDQPDIYKVFKNGDDLLHASMLVRSGWAKKNKYLKGFDRAEDRELFTRTLGESIYKIIPEPLYYYLDVQNMTLEKYLKSYKSERKAIINNWKGKISLFQMFYTVIRSLLKSFIIRFYFWFKIEHQLFSNKMQPLSSSEISQAQKNISSFTS